MEVLKRSSLESVGALNFAMQEETQPLEFSAFRACPVVSYVLPKLKAFRSKLRALNYKF